jgi:hypothetical protein
MQDYLSNFGLAWTKPFPSIAYLNWQFRLAAVAHSSAAGHGTLLTQFASPAVKLFLCFKPLFAARVLPSSEISGFLYAGLPLTFLFFLVGLGFVFIKIRSQFFQRSAGLRVNSESRRFQ